MLSSGNSRVEAIRSKRSSFLVLLSWVISVLLTAGLPILLGKGVADEFFAAQFEKVSTQSGLFRVATSGLQPPILDFLSTSTTDQAHSASKFPV